MLTFLLWHWNGVENIFEVDVDLVLEAIVAAACFHCLIYIESFFHLTIIHQVFLIDQSILRELSQLITTWKLNTRKKTSDKR